MEAYRGFMEVYGWFTEAYGRPMEAYGRSMVTPAHLPERLREKNASGACFASLLFFVSDR